MSALQLRNHVLDRLERATAATDPTERRRLMTFCIVGGGPTGVEYAGALAELARLVLPYEYPELRPHELRIVLLEGGDRVLPTFKRRLSMYPRRELERRGVDVRTDVLVASADESGVVTRDGNEVPTATIVWTAGVRPADLLGASRHHAHRAASLRGRRSPPRARNRPRARDRRRCGCAGPQGAAAADAFTSGDASRSLRRPGDRRRRPAARVPLPRQGNNGDDRAPCRRRADRPRSS